MVLGNNLLAPDAASAGEYAQLNAGPAPAWANVDAFGNALATIASVGAAAYQGGRVWTTTVPSGMAGADLLDVTVPQVTAGVTYTFSAQAQAVTAGQNPSTFAAIGWIGTAGQTLSTTSGSPTVLTGGAGTWTQLVVTGAAPAGAVAAVLRVVTTTTPSAASTVWTDGLQLEARGYPTRFQMPWTPGTNLLPQTIATGSESMSVVTDAVTNWWTPAAGTVSQVTNLTAAPTGGTTAVAWALSSGTTTSYALYAGVAAAGGTGPVADNVQVTAGSSYTASAYLTRTGPDATVTVTAKIAWFTSSGTLLSTTTGAAATVPTGGAWVRATASGTAPAGAAWGRMYVAVASPGTFTGTETIYATGWQMEQAAAVSTWADPGAPCFLFTGLVERFPGTYDDLDGTYGTSKLECVDATAALSQFPLLSPFVQEVLALGPSFLYQLNEPAGAASCADTAGRRIPAPVENSPYGAGLLVFGNSITSTNPTLKFIGTNGPVATFNNNPSNAAPFQLPQTFVSLHKTSSTPGPPSNSAWTRMLAFRAPTVPGTNNLYGLWIAVPTTYNAANQSLFQIALNATGFAYLRVQSATGANASWTGSTNLCDGNWHMVAIGYDPVAATVTMWVDGAVATTFTGIDAGSAFKTDSLGCAIEYGVNLYADGYVGDLADAAEFPFLLTSAQVTNLYSSWRTASSGESSGARYARILKWIGWTGPASIASGSTQSMGPATDTSGQVPLDALNGTATTENGESYINAAGTLTFTARSALYGVRTPVVVFGEGRPVGNAGEWPCEVGSIDFDPSHLANVVQVTQYNGPIYTATDATSIRRYYSRLYQRTVNVSAGSEAQDAATYLLSQIKDPHQRAEAIGLHPAAIVGLFPVAARLDKNARIRYIKRPVGSPSRTLDAFIQRIVWSWPADTNDVTVQYQASPADLANYWRIGALYTTLSAQAASAQANATINALPDAAWNILAQSMPSSQVLWFEPGTPRFEAVTVKTIPSTVLGYATATLVMTGNFAFTHPVGSVVCEPLPTAVTDPTSWDTSSVLGASYAPILSGGAAGTNTVTVGPLPDGAYNAFGRTWNTGDTVVLSSGGSGTAETATIQSVSTTYPGYTSAVITFTANLANNHPAGDNVSDVLLTAGTNPATFAPTTRVTYAWTLPVLLFLLGASGRLPKLYAGFAVPSTAVLLAVLGVGMAALAVRARRRRSASRPPLLSGRIHVRRWESLMANLPVPNPRTAVAGEFETAAMMNLFRDAINFLTNRPRAALYQTTAQSVANAVWTATSFDSTLLDTYGGHSNTTNNSRYTAQVPGWYSLRCGGGWVTGAAGGGRGASIYKNGAFYTAGAAVVGSTNVIHSTPVSKDVFLAVGDYVELFVWQNSGGALNTAGSGQYASWMDICWEGI